MNVFVYCIVFLFTAFLRAEESSTYIDLAKSESQSVDLIDFGASANGKGILHTVYIVNSSKTKPVENFKSLIWEEEFFVDNYCPRTIQPNSKCEIVLEFWTVNKGWHSGTFIINSSLFNKNIRLSAASVLRGR